jgi:hypothetical protein
VPASICRQLEAGQTGLAGRIDCPHEEHPGGRGEGGHADHRAAARHHRVQLGLIQWQLVNACDVIGGVRRVGETQTGEYSGATHPRPQILPAYASVGGRQASGDLLRSSKTGL